jgi:DNA-binding transcriptional regulator GbsR (MarR family)
MLGATRTMGRVYGWLMICDPPQQSLSQIAEALSVSKASVSTVARQLRKGGMIQRLPAASREHHYRVAPGGSPAS